MTPHAQSSSDGFSTRFAAIHDEIARVVVGQPDLVFGLLVGVIAGGHVLVEGAPGLGKTLLARTLARVSAVSFKRIQFTPDLMPSDITGSSIYDRRDGSFAFVPGPVFCQILLADEINRAPAKTQAALLEAMQEQQVTVDGSSRPLPSPFVVVATQNPVESQGTYPLPEAQLDRFLFKLLAGDPPAAEEARIVRHHVDGFDPTDLGAVRAVTTPDELLALRAAAQRVRVEDAVVGYAVEIVRHTRSDRAIELGASPRASIAMTKAAQVVAASQARDFVTPDDVKSVAKNVLRHRIVMHPDAELQGVSADARLDELLRAVAVPRLA